MIRPAAGEDLVRVAHHLVPDLRLGGKDHGGNVRLDQGDGAVLHLRRLHALRVDVGDLLQLQRPLERRRVFVEPPDVEEVLAAARTCVAISAMRSFWPISPRACSGSFSSASRNRSPARRDMPAHAAHVHRQQAQHDELAGERLGGSHPDLGPGVDVDSLPALPRDAGARRRCRSRWSPRR